MGDPFYMFFCLGPALQALFKIDYLPIREDFKELSDSQYLKYKSEYGETEEKLYLLLPEDPKEYSKLELANQDCAIVFSDSEMEDILNAVE